MFASRRSSADRRALAPSRRTPLSHRQNFPLRNAAMLLVAQLLFTSLATSQTQPRSATSSSDSNLDHQPPTASAYVPLDSYVYPLLDRLSAESLFDTAFLGIRPWTRAQCARLVEQAEERANDDAPAFTRAVLKRLHNEFRPELEPTLQRAQLSVDDVYFRSQVIAGSPIPDPHFGQTLYNDYGRRSSEGGNTIFGLAASQLFGPFLVHLRTEFQNAAPAIPLSSTTQKFIASVDAVPFSPRASLPRTNVLRAIEAYAGVHIRNTNITVGKQSLWWGPSPTSAMLFSTNVEPMYMLRIQQDQPKELPWIFRYLGPMRWDAFFGKLSGHQFPSGPFLHGQKVSFKPTPNLEFGFSRTVEFAGAGHPLTLGSFWKSFISVGDNPTATPGSARDVGDRRGGFDFSYRLPKLRDRVTIYGDFFTDDDPSPLSAPHRSAMLPGIYISKLPFLDRADLRLESVSTAQPSVDNFHGRFFYYNDGYRDGYTNKSQVIGSWIGRDSKAIVASSRYWFSPDSDIALAYRNVKLANEFVAGGGTQHDFRVAFRKKLSSRTEASGFVQYEQWKIPLLHDSLQRNVAISFQLSYSPGVLRHAYGGKP